MILDHAVERALNGRNMKRAAVLANDIEFELALGALTAEQEVQGEAPPELLEQRYPGVREAAREVDQPPSPFRRAGRRLRKRPVCDAEEVSRRRGRRRRTVLGRVWRVSVPQAPQLSVGSAHRQKWFSGHTMGRTITLCTACLMPLLTVVGVAGASERAASISVRRVGGTSVVQAHAVATIGLQCPPEAPHPVGADFGALTAAGRAQIVLTASYPTGRTGGASRF
jgi:hypothetical protein